MPSPNNDDGSLTVYLVQAAGGEFDGNIQGDAYFIFIFSPPLGYLRIHNLSLREKNTTTTTTTITTTMLLQLLLLIQISKRMSSRFL